MKETDITGDKFDFIDFSEGNIFFRLFFGKRNIQSKRMGINLYA